MNKPTPLFDFDGQMISVGEVLTTKHNKLCMIHQPSKLEIFYLGWNKGPYKMTELPYFADIVDQKYINQMHMRIDRGHWIEAFETGGTQKIHSAYHLSQMSNLFNPPEVVYFSERDLKFIKWLEAKTQCLNTIE